MVYKVQEDYKKAINMRVVEDDTGESIYSVKLVFGFNAD